MTKAFKRPFIFLIAFIILVTSNGVVLAIHTCLFTSDKSVTLFAEKSCCDAEKKSCNDKSDCNDLTSACCKSEIAYNKISSPFLLSKITAPVVDQVVFTFPVIAKQEDVFEVIFATMAPPLLPADLPFVYHQLLI